MLVEMGKSTSEVAEVMVSFSFREDEEDLYLPSPLATPIDWGDFQLSQSGSNRSNSLAKERREREAHSNTLLYSQQQPEQLAKSKQTLLHHLSSSILIRSVTAIWNWNQNQHIS